MWYRISAKKKVSLVIVFDGDKVLLGEKSSGYEIPGGHVNHLEDEKDCAKREIEEETNLKISKLHNLRVMDMSDKVVNVYYTKDFSGNLLAGDDLIAVSWHKVKDLPKIKFNGAELILEAYEKSSQ
jgi:ADP-ribose pyrophosphatase YjhB (NUDIX family)